MKTILISFVVLTLYGVLAQPAKDDPDIMSNTIDGTDDAELVPELAGNNKKEISGTDKKTVVVKSRKQHTYSVFFGSGIRFSNGKIFLNGKEVTIEKDNDTIQCNTIKCPKDSIKCAVRQSKNPDNKNETIITSQCADKDNKILLSDKQNEPITSESDGNCYDHEAYVEMSFGEGSTEILNAEVAAEIDRAQAEFDQIQKEITETFRRIWESNPFQSIYSLF